MSTMQSLLIGGFLNFAGPITLLALLFWLNSLWTVVGPFHLLVREHWKVISLALLGSVIVFCSTAIGFKVLSDETNLLSVANMLTIFGKASNTEMWQYYYHNYHALDVSVPSRPILFPLMVSLVEMVVGIKWWSPFVVNFAALVLLFSLVLYWAQKNVPDRLLPRSTTLLALLMSPILSIAATSGGYDLVSLAVGFGCFLLLFEYERRGDSATLECLLFGLICFASVRYESIIALPFTAAGLYLLEGKAIFKKVQPQTIVVAAIMILPLVVQRYLTWGSFENPPDRAPFSLRNAMDWTPVFLTSFFKDGNGPYPILLHWLGLGGLALAVRRMKGVAMIPLVFMGFVLLLLLSHHFGRADHPTQARLFIPISFGLVALAIYFLRDMEKFVDPRYLLMIFVVLTFHHRQYAVQDPLTAQLTMTREVKHIREFLAVDNRPGDLWVYDRPGQLSAMGLSAISWNKFRDDNKSYLENLKVGLYNRMLIIERPSYKRSAPDPFALQRNGYRLVPLREHELTPDEELRISVLELTPGVAGEVTPPAPVQAPPVNTAPGAVMIPAKPRT
ncbi:MAG: hypothetical protein ACXWR1_08515 [Bdellovibrionota bacterium]